MEKLLIALLLLVGAVKFLPLVGVLGPHQLTSLYGIPFEGSDLSILMRHRAALFGFIGGFIMLAAFKPELRPYAIAAGFISTLSFVALVFSAGDYNAHLRKIAITDIVLAVALAAALALHLAGRRS